MKSLMQATFVVASMLATTSAFGQGRLIGINGTGVYEINQNTAAITQISTLTAGAGTIGGLAYDAANGIMYMISSQNQNLMTVNVDTGAWSVIGTFGLGTNPIMQGLEYDSGANRLYGHSAGSSHGFFLYELNTSTGAATNVGQSSLTSFHNLGYDSINGVMYMTNSSTDSLYTLDTSNNTSTLVGVLGGTPTSTNPNSLAFNRDNGVMYMLDNSTDHLYTVNLQTGAATAIGSVGSSNFLAMAYIPIPAPGALLAFGVAALMPKRRRR